MYPHQWEPFWERIRQEMGYDEAADKAAAERLNELIDAAEHGPVIDYAHRIIAGKTVRVLGAGSGNEARLGRVRKRPLIVAGSAVARARSEGAMPEILVTDLDGDLDAHLWAAGHGALVFVHAHADNVDLIDDVVPRLPRHQVAGTCQVPAFGHLINPGGFTDGDRACYIAHAMEARGAELIGFTFPERPGKKLAWAKRSLDHLHEGGPFEVAPWETSSATHDA